MQVKDKIETEQQHTQIAQLVLESFPQFYGCLTDDTTAQLEAVKKELATKSTELANVFFVETENEVAAAITFYNSKEFLLRQVSGLRTLLPFAVDQQRTLQDMKAFGDKLERNLPPSLYLSRFTVKKEYRGQKMHEPLFEKIFEYAAQNGFDKVSLHLHKHNISAIITYKKYNFSFLSENYKQFDFPIMVKNG